MPQADLLALGSGTAAVYSSRSPEKAEANEDAAALVPIDDETSVVIVADGLGGLTAGDLASRLAIDCVTRAVQDGTRNGLTLSGAIVEGFERANHAVMRLSVRAASTLAVVAIHNQDVRPYHAGDSRVLVVGQRGKIKLHSVAHSPVGQLVELGFLDEREALYHEERHLVSNVVGTPDMRIEIGSPLTLSPRDTLLVASDGLWDNMYVHEIITCIRKGPLAQAVDRLVERSQTRMKHKPDLQPSKPDDLTVVLYRPG